jgi:putative transposase
VEVGEGRPRPSDARPLKWRARSWQSPPARASALVRECVDREFGVSRNYVVLYVHLVWATWDRLPLITPELEPRLYGFIPKKCSELRCRALAAGGAADHVHVLAELHPTVAVATLVKEIKGASAHLITQEVAGTVSFRWQRGYGAFTLRRDDIDRIADYVRNQKRHHAASALLSDLERIDG